MYIMMARIGGRVDRWIGGQVDRFKVHTTAGKKNMIAYVRTKTPMECPQALEAGVIPSYDTLNRKQQSLLFSLYSLVLAETPYKLQAPGESPMLLYVVILSLTRIKESCMTLYMTLCMTLCMTDVSLRAQLRDIRSQSISQSIFPLATNTKTPKTHTYSEIGLVAWKSRQGSQAKHPQ